MIVVGVLTEPRWFRIASQCDFIAVRIVSRLSASVTVGYLSFGPIEKCYDFFYSVREKDWRAGSQAFERMHNTLSHGSKT
jgi:hypothetical protein